MYRLVFWFSGFLVFWLLAGCANFERTESGTGVTVGRTPVVGVGSDVPQAIIYDYSTKMPAGPPLQESTVSGAPAPFQGPRIHGTATFDNPTVVVFVNQTGTYDTPIWFEVRINDGEPIALGPGESSANQYLPFGEHKVQIKGRKDVPPFGEVKLEDRILTVDVRPQGRAKVIYLRE